MWNKSGILKFIFNIKRSLYFVHLYTIVLTNVVFLETFNEFSMCYFGNYADGSK